MTRDYRHGREGTQRAERGSMQNAFRDATHCPSLRRTRSTSFVNVAPPRLRGGLLAVARARAGRRHREVHGDLLVRDEECEYWVEGPQLLKLFDSKCRRSYRLPVVEPL